MAEFDEIVANADVDWDGSSVADADGFRRFKAVWREPEAEGFILLGPKGAVEAWRIINPAVPLPAMMGWVGGVEFHKSSQPNPDYPTKPSMRECHLLKAPCWHNGSGAAINVLEDRGIMWNDDVYAELERQYEFMWGWEK